MAKSTNKNTEKVVRITVLKPFHIGVGRPVYYKPGSVEVSGYLADRLIKRGLAKLEPVADAQQEKESE